MTPDPGRLRAAMATLLVAATVLFVVGIVGERWAGSGGTPQLDATSPPVAASNPPQVEGSGEGGGEAAESHAPKVAVAESSAETGAAAGHAETGSGEAILGIDPEAPALVGLAIVLSLLAAFLIWRDGRRLVIAGAIVVAFGFAALDVLEVSHQAREGAALLAVIAGLVTCGHLLAAAAGVAVLRRPETA